MRSCLPPGLHGCANRQHVARPPKHSRWYCPLAVIGAGSNCPKIGRAPPTTGAISFIPRTRLRRSKEMLGEPPCERSYSFRLSLLRQQGCGRSKRSILLHQRRQFRQPHNNCYWFGARLGTRPRAPWPDTIAMGPMVGVCSHPLFRWTLGAKEWRGDLACTQLAMLDR